LIKRIGERQDNKVKTNSFQGFFKSIKIVAQSLLIRDYIMYFGIYGCMIETTIFMSYMNDIAIIPASKNRSMRLWEINNKYFRFHESANNIKYEEQVIHIYIFL
jgi:hypothetical protein